MVHAGRENLKILDHSASVEHYHQTLWKKPWVIDSANNWRVLCVNEVLHIQLTHLRASACRVGNCVNEVLHSQLTHLRASACRAGNCV